MTDHMIFTICSTVVFYTSSNKAVDHMTNHMIFCSAVVFYTSSNKAESTVERKTEIMTSYIVGAQKS